MRFPTEASVIYSTLKDEGMSVSFYNGNITKEQKIVKALETEKPEEILVYLHTPYIHEKQGFLKAISEHCRHLYAVLIPFFWGEKILEEFSFIEKVTSNENRLLGIHSEDTQIRYEELETERFSYGSFPIMLTKYCPYGCTFCNVRRTRLLKRRVDIVVDEIKNLYKKYGLTDFYLQDNNVTMGKKRLTRLCDLLRELGFNFAWSSDGRINEIDEETVEMLKKSRCSGLLFGVESANQEILDFIQKDITTEQVSQVAELHHVYGLPFRFSFLFGFPQDSEETYHQMMSMIKKTKPQIAGCNPVAPYPTTPLFEQMKKEGLIKKIELDYLDFGWERLPIAPTRTLSKAHVKKLINRARSRSYLRGIYLKELIKTRSIKDYPRIIRKGLFLIKGGLYS